MTYDKAKNDFINEITDRIRQKIEVLDSDESVKVEFSPSHPLRNSNPAIWVYITSPKLMAEAAFWSGKTFEVGAYKIEENEIIRSDAGYFSSLDDVNRYIEDLVSLFLPNT